MRKKLQQLLKKTLVWKYSLPNKAVSIDGVNVSTLEDDAFLCACENSLAEIIYNSIIEYSFNEFEMSNRDLKDLLTVALQVKIKYKEWQTEGTKVRYGFYGEVLLHSILYYFYGSRPLISRGYFYNPLENSETKGYDSYHLIESNGNVELWFGEVKFRDTFASCAKSAIEGLDKALSDSYLRDNILAMVDHRNNFSIKDSKVEKIIKSWSDNPSIKIIDEIKKYDMSLIYPVLLVYADQSDDFETKISSAVKHINRKYSAKQYNLSINFELFFILVPLSEVKKIKKDVIEWIELKKPLLS